VKRGAEQRWAARPELRALIESARGDDPSDEQIALLRTRLLPLARATPTSPRGGTLPRGVARHAAAYAQKRMPLLVAGALVMLALGWRGARSVSLSLDPPVVLADERLLEGAPAVPWLEGAAEPESATFPSVSASEGSAVRTSGDAKGSHPALGADALDSSEPEAALLLRAHRALVAGDDGAALASTDEHRRRFPTGALASEREVIAIEALAHGGSTAAARARAVAFRKAFPTSAYAGRIDALAGGAPRAP
jgi:hypothetical protein